MISMGLVLKIVMIAGGILLFIRQIFSIADRKMTEIYSVSWVLFSLFILIAGIIIHPAGIERYIGWQFFILLLLFLVVVLEGIYRISLHQSDLFRKNSELSMQVALLNQENAELYDRLNDLKKIERQESGQEEGKQEKKDEKEDTVCH